MLLHVKVCILCGRGCVGCIEMLLSVFASVRKVEFVVTKTFLCHVCTGVLLALAQDICLWFITCMLWPQFLPGMSMLFCFMFINCACVVSVKGLS